MALFLLSHPGTPGWCFWNASPTVPWVKEYSFTFGPLEPYQPHSYCDSFLLLHASPCPPPLPSCFYLPAPSPWSLLWHLSQATLCPSIWVTAHVPQRVPDYWDHTVTSASSQKPTEWEVRPCAHVPQSFRYSVGPTHFIY